MKARRCVFIIILIAKAAINCLVCVSFASIKNGPGGQVEAKKFKIFVKNINLLPVDYLTSSAKQMLFQHHKCVSKVKVKEFVFILLFLCIFICIICMSSLCILYVCILFICLYLRIHGLFQTVRAQVYYLGHIGKKGILLAHTAEGQSRCHF